MFNFFERTQNEKDIILLRHAHEHLRSRINKQTITMLSFRDRIDVLEKKLNEQDRIIGELLAELRKHTS